MRIITTTTTTKKKRENNNSKTKHKKINRNSVQIRIGIVCIFHPQSNFIVERMKMSDRERAGEREMEREREREWKKAEYSYTHREESGCAQELVERSVEKRRGRFFLRVVCIEYNFIVPIF